MNLTAQMKTPKPAPNQSTQTLPKGGALSLPKGWREVRLGDVAELSKISWKVCDEQFPYIGLEHIGEDKLRLNSIGNSSSVASNKYRFNAGDTLFGKLRPYFRKVLLAKFDGICSTDIWVVKPKGKTDNVFLFYFFANPSLVNISYSSSSGTRMPRADWNFLSETLWDLPPLSEQKVIAEVLSSLDDKIDLLHRQNKTLEDMAQTLFRKWFIDEADEDWEFVKFGQFINCFNGISYKSDDLNPSTTAMVSLKSFDRESGFRLDGFKQFTGKYKEQHVVAQGDLVVAHTDITQDAAVIGNPALVVSDPLYEKLVISMDLVKVCSKHTWLSNEFLYRMMRTREFKQHCLGYSNGSTVLHLSKQAIPSYEFFMPPKERILEYTELAKNLFGKKFENITQVRTLEKLRDTLLPKLMNGNIRISPKKTGLQ